MRALECAELSKTSGSKTFDVQHTSRSPRLPCYCGFVLPLRNIYFDNSFS